MRDVEADIYIRQADLRPWFETTLTDRDGNPLDLTDATNVVFSMRSVTTGVTKIDNGAATIVGDPVDGNVRYEPSGTVTDTPGDFEGEFEVTWSPDSDPEGVPARNSVLVRVTPRIDAT